MSRTMPKQKPWRSVQDVRTPPALLRSVCTFLDIEKFDWDLAATRENSVAGPHYFSEAQNALIRSWSVGGRWCWCNPPYANLDKWARKACLEKWSSREAGVKSGTVMLVPASVGANWWRDHVHQQALVLFLNGRLTFVGHTTPYPKDCAVLIYSLYHDPGYRVWNWKETR